MRHEFAIYCRETNLQNIYRGGNYVPGCASDKTRRANVALSINNTVHMRAENYTEASTGGGGRWCADVSLRNFDR